MGRQAAVELEVSHSHEKPDFLQTLLTVAVGIMA
jgi:hypothetical protein